MSGLTEYSEGRNMRILILGAGLMAQGAAFDYLNNPGVESLVVADLLREALARFKRRFPDDRLRTVEADARDSKQVTALMAEADAVLRAIHDGFNLEFTKIAIATRTHMVDLGGNTDAAVAGGLCDPSAVCSMRVVIVRFVVIADKVPASPVRAESATSTCPTVALCDFLDAMTVKG
jgi:hypothetical protein